jgi:hypothetical protein
MVGEIDNWRRAAHNRDCPHALRHGGGCCVGVGSATGNPEHAKCADAKMIDQLSHNGRPIAQSTIGLQTRSAHAGPIRGNNTNPQVTGVIICESRHRARAWPAMTKYHRYAARVAVLLKRDYTSVFKLNEIFITHFKNTRTLSQRLHCNVALCSPKCGADSAAVASDIIRYERLLTTSGGKNFAAW